MQRIIKRRNGHFFAQKLGIVFKTASCKVTCYDENDTADLLAQEAHYFYQRRKTNPSKGAAKFRKAIRREFYKGCQLKMEFGFTY